MTGQAHKKSIQVAASCLVTFAICAWLYFVTDWAEVGAHLRELRRWDLLIVAAVAFYLQVALRALRWSWLLPPPNTETSPLGTASPVASANTLSAAAAQTRGAEPERNASLRLLFHGIMLGNLWNYFLPLRAGELVRPFVVATRTRTPYVTCLASTVVERFFDLLTVLLAFGWMLATRPELPTAFYAAAYAITTGAIAILVLIIVSARFPTHTLAAAGWLLQPVPRKYAEKALQLIVDFNRGTRRLGQPGRLGLVFVGSLAVWFCTFWLFQLLLGVCNLEMSFTFAISITVMIALAIAVPSSPGFIGVFEFACIAAFAMHGESREQAVSYGIVAHAFHYLLVGLYGLGWLASGVKELRLTSRATRENARTT